MQRKEDTYFGKPAPRKDILKLLEKDLQTNVYHEQILISFIGDVYCDNTDDSATTRAALELLSAYHAPVAALSKGGEKMLRDLDIFKTFEGRIAVGTTLTFLDETKSDKWQDWRQYLLDCIALLRPAGKEVYYKFCLRRLAPDVVLTQEEKNPDEYIVRA